MLLEKLLQYGFVTGSQAFGTARPDSDIDVVFAIQDQHKIDEILAGYERENSLYFSGFYVNDEDGKQINLIPVHPHDFLPWYLATRAVSASLKDSEITDPIKKYSLFQCLVGIFRGLVEERGDLQNYNMLKEEILAKANAPKEVSE